MSLPKQLSFVLVIAVALFLLAIAIFSTTMTPSAVAAQDLPPRPTVVPTATTQPAVVPDSAFVGGTIRLSLADETMPTAGLWTAIQWQDANDGWHTVEGWQGAFDPLGVVIWWVAPRDLGTGPFRWQLFTAEDGDLLANSDPFTLPASTAQMVLVEVSP